MVSSIVDNGPAGWDYGCVLGTSDKIQSDSHQSIFFYYYLVLTPIMLTTCSRTVSFSCYFLGHEMTN